MKMIEFSIFEDKPLMVNPIHVSHVTFDERTVATRRTCSDDDLCDLPCSIYMTNGIRHQLIDSYGEVCNALISCRL